MLLKGIEWFGNTENSWGLISKYFFMEERTPEFLRLYCEFWILENLKRRTSRGAIERNFR